MLVCANCGKVLKECCDIFVECENKTTGEDCVVCGDCAADLGLADGEE